MTRCAISGLGSQYHKPGHLHPGRLSIRCNPAGRYIAACSGRSPLAGARAGCKSSRRRIRSSLGGWVRSNEGSGMRRQ